MEVKQVTADHREQTIELMKKYFEFYERKIPPYDSLNRHITRFFENQEFGIQFIACDGDLPAGFATLYFTYSTMSLIPISIMNDLYVEPNYRGKGVADSLFDKCIEYSKSRGIHKMEWVTATDNYRAQKFYDRKGGEKSTWMMYDLNF